MPQPAKGTRLWLEPEERDASGKLIHRAAWVIRDGSRKVRTGCAAGDREGAERNLSDYIARKYQAPRESGRAPDQILVLDVLNIYASDAVPKHKRPNETMQRLLTLGAFPGWHALADVNGKQCRAYVAWRMAQPWKSSRPEKPDTRRGRSAQRGHGVNWKICGPRSTITARRGCVPRLSAWRCPTRASRVTLG